MGLEHWSKKKIEERGNSHLPLISKEDVDRWLKDCIHKKNLQYSDEEE